MTMIIEITTVKHSLDDGLSMTGAWERKGS